MSDTNETFSLEKLDEIIDLVMKEEHLPLFIVECAEHGAHLLPSVGKSLTGRPVVRFPRADCRMVGMGEH